MALGTPMMGVNGDVKLWDDPTETAVLEMVSWNLDVTGDNSESSPFGNNGWNRLIGMAGKKWTATFEGLRDAGDAQDTLRELILTGKAGTGTVINNKLNAANGCILRLYTDSTHYWTPDLAGGGEAVLTGYTENTVAADAIKVNMTVAGSGPIEYITVT